MALEISMRQLHSITERELDELLSGGGVVITVDNQAKYKVSLLVSDGYVNKGSRVSPDDIQAKETGVPLVVGVENTLKQDDIQAKISGLRIEGNRIVGVEKVASFVDNQAESEYIPWYDARKHQPGDKVRMRNAQGKVVIIAVPELDADGNPAY